MKKGIIAIAVTLTMLLIGLNKVDAMSLDGTIIKEVRVNTATRTESNLFSNDYTLLHYFNNNTIYSGDGDVAVFVISGYTGYYQGIDPDNTGYETLNMNNILYSIKLINSSGYTWTSCELQNNRIVCPMIKGHGNYGGLEFRFHSDGEDIYFTFQINQYAILYNKDNTIIKDSIDSQTQQQHQDYEDFMEENHTYSDDPSREINGTNELNEYSQKEDQLMNSLDLNMSLMDQITINPNASTYIWSIVERLRQINPAIILLMTSILGMGLIKMVLNR